MNRRHWLGVAAAAVAGAVHRPLLRAADLGPDPKTWDGLVSRGYDYLKDKQATDGSWSKEKNLGVTGVVVAGLLQTGKYGADDPVVAKGLKFIESLVNVKEGHIAGQGPKPQLLNYVTSINVLALKASKQDDKYKKIIANASDFLKKLQWDEEEGKTKDNDFYGGAGYDSKSRPDLSNTQFFLDALKAAGVPETDPAYKRAIIFISRCQNLKSEFNDQPWAGKIDDGSFIYSAAGGGQTKADGTPETGLAGYGSMTYAGIKSLIHCGLTKDDPRVNKALDWTKKHYALDLNPGMPKARAHQGLYYYYLSMAKCLEVLGVKKLETADGKEHDWRADIAEVLAKLQRKDGSWTNELDAWMEGDPNLVTGYVLMTLGHLKPMKV